MSATKASAGKHILFLVENASYPMDRRVFKEAEVAQQMGFRVSVISPKGVDTDRERFVDLDGIRVYRYRPRVMGSGFLSYLVEYSNAFFMSAWLILRINLKDRIDVFHVANPPDIFFPIIQIYRLFGAKYIFDVHDLFLNTFESKFQSKRSFFKKTFVKMVGVSERLNMKSADLIVVTNQSYSEYIRERYHIPPGEIFIVRNAPRLDERSNVPCDGSLKRGKTYMILYFGVFGEDDGVDVVLRSLHYLVNTKGFTDFVCYLIGPTNIEASSAIAELKTLHRRLHLESYVYFTGFLPWKDVHRYLNTADVGLSPDLFTVQNNLSTMLKIMEYMSHGLPILSFDLKENRFSAGEAALYCNGYSSEDFAESLEQLLLDRPAREAMRGIGLERYRTRFNWEVSQEILKTVYEHFRNHQ